VSSGPGRYSRRRALGSAVKAAGAAAAGGLLAGCGTSFRALTQAASRAVVLTWLPWYRFPTTETGVNAKTLQAFMEDMIQGWLATQSGVSVRVLPSGNATTTVASMLAGAGPDVFWDVNLPLYAQQGLVLDLAPYASRDRIDLSGYIPAQLDYIRSVGAAAGGTALYALPATARVLAQGLYEGGLDRLGLGYPQPGWTAEQWAHLWAQVAAASGRQEAGARLSWEGYDGGGANPSPFYLRGFGGEYADPADPARAALGSPASQAGLNWCYGQLLEGTALGGSDLSVANAVLQGKVVCGPLGTAGDLYDAVTAWRSLGKWDLYPMPLWPQGHLTGVSSDFYAVWSGTSAPDLAWDLLRYLCVGTDWQSKMMAMALAGPNQKALWTDWAGLVTRYASPLAQKNLGAFLDAVAGDQLYVGVPFRFQEQQVAAVLQTFGGDVLSGRQTVAAAAPVAAAQIDALEQAGAAAAAAAAAALGKLRRASGASATPARPSTTPPA
jgi:hypothetical protein